MLDIQTVTAFFMWCSIVNASILGIWSFFILLLPDMVYKTQNRWFKISKETFNIAIYGFIGLYKMMFLFFNLIPYIVIKIIA